MTDDLSPISDSRVEYLFSKALEMPIADRKFFLSEQCADDDALRAEVESLLRQHDRAGSFLESPPPPPGSSAFGDLDKTFEECSRSEAHSDEGESLAEQIAGYRILRRLGVGGMGVVYVAEQDNPQREVAIKVIRSGVASRESLRRFEHEARILGRLHHPGIAQVYEAGMFGAGPDARPYFAMEYVRGRPLNEFIKERRLSPDHRLELFVQICDAVHHAHVRGVIHRDIKPANILVDDAGRPRVLDFGVARVTDEDVQSTTLRTDIGQLVGTVPYMSPEQIDGDPDAIDQRCDVYGLGVLLFELLTGRLPYDIEQKRVHEVARIIRDVEPTRLSSIDRDLRGDIETIAIKALEKDRERRYQSVAALADDVRRYLRDEPIAARPPSATYLLRKFARRNKPLVGGIAAAFLVLIAGVVATSFQAVRATRAEREAVLRAEESERNAATAEAVAAFLSDDILAAASPEFTPNREMTVREALDRAAEHVGQAEFDSAAIESSIHLAIAEAYFALGEYDRADPHLNAILELARDSRLAARTEPDARALLASSALHRGDFEEGRRQFDELLAKLPPRVEQYDVDDFQLLSAAASWSSVLDIPLATAISMSETAIEGRARVLGEFHNDTLKSRHVLAVLLQQADRLEEAKSLSEEVYDARRRISGADHPWSISALAALAKRLAALDELETAEAHFREAIERTSRVMGADTMSAAEMQRELANVLRRQGRATEAIELHRDSLESIERAYGPEFVATLNSRNDLALALADTGQLDEAISLLDSVREGYMREYGESNRSTIIALRNLADLRRRAGDLETAEEDAREAIRLASDALGDTDILTLRCRYSLQMALILQGKDAAAAEAMKETIELQNEAFGAANEHARMTTYHLSGALFRLGELQEARDILAPLLEQCLQTVGPDNPETFRVRSNLGAVLLALEDFSGAEEQFVECLRLAPQLLPPANPTLAALADRHVKALAGQGRFREAIDSALAAYALFASAGEDGGESARMLAVTLADLYDQWSVAEPDADHDAESDVWRAKAAGPSSSDGVEVGN